MLWRPAIGKSFKKKGRGCTPDVLNKVFGQARMADLIF